MSAPQAIPTAGRPAARSAPARAEAPVLPAAPARLLGFTAAAGFGAVQWGQIVTPGAGGAMAAAMLAALVAGGALAAVACARASAAVRRTAGVLAAVAVVLLALVAAGLPGALLAPRGWDELAAGIAQGVTALPSVTLPYGGVDEWTRTVLVAGGGALVGVAALLAFAPRRDGRFGYPVAATVALGTLYAVPIVQRDVEQPFLGGLGFALALALFLWLERVERRSAALAATLVAGAALAGLAAAPRLDGARALLDYEQLAQSLSPASTQYNWNHTYGPLDWPRDGREVLRVRSPRRAYWKAVNLSSFDGQLWAHDVRPEGSAIDTPIAEREWVQSIRVTVRALRSTQFVAAGTTLRVDDSPRGPVRTSPGVLETQGRPLRRGQAYRARVYVPDPGARRLRAAGTVYPPGLDADYGVLRVPVERSGFGASLQAVAVPFWGAAATPAERRLSEQTIAASPYARVLDLANRLRARSATPYDFVRAVERHLERGFSYSEDPPASRAPLADFLLRDRVGYCQQFSGAMALLLRLGGVPARVSAGFAPGNRDDRRREYVVRDIDAHSWVEVYFPGIGWVTRDPTPAASPARSQAADLAAIGRSSGATIGGAGERALGGNTDARAAAQPAAAGEREASSRLPAIVGAGVLAAATAAAAIVLARRRRRRAQAADELAELRRALRRSGREPQPQLTLEALAARLAGTAAEGYVRALAAGRYGYEAAPPSPAARAALRRELAAGRGVGGRLRSWWALPPRPHPHPLARRG
jgi:protein-glutamine gamma-glutamyltransferase